MYRHVSIPLVAALGAILSLPSITRAAGDPMVVPGIGSGGTNGAGVAPRAPARGNYGGGFIELLVTGRDPTPRAVAAPMPAVQPQGADMNMGASPVMPLRAAPSSERASLAPARPAVLGVEPQFMRQEVDYHGPYGAGTLVVDTPNRFLFLVQPNGRALRYGIGVGRPGFEWAGLKKVTRKAEWPGWTPPPEMLKRRPDLPRHMDGGPENPLGARALYLGSSLYRIYGTNEPDTIGRNVSSGCIRMMNEDVIDLYNRVPVGSKVVII